MKVHVTTIQTSTKRRAVAEVTIVLTDGPDAAVTISGIRVLQDRFDHAYVAMPRVSVSDGGGSHYYVPVMECNFDLELEIKHCVLEAYGQWSRGCSDAEVGA